MTSSLKSWPFCVSGREHCVRGDGKMLDMEQMQQNALAELAQVTSSESLEAWRQAYLGRTGQLTSALRGIGQLPPSSARPPANWRTRCGRR